MMLRRPTEWLRVIRQSMRAARRAPIYALTISLSLAAGVSILTLGYALIQADHAHSWEGAGATNAVVVTETSDASCRQCTDVFSVVTFRDWTRRKLRTLPQFGAYAERAVRYGNSASRQVIPAAIVGGDFFDSLGLVPLFGKLPSATQLASHTPIAVISYSAWQGLLGRDPKILERTLPLDGQLYLVVAVLAPNQGMPLAARMWLSGIDEKWLSPPLEQGLIGVGKRSPTATNTNAEVELRAARHQTVTVRNDSLRGVSVSSLSEWAHGEANNGSALLMWAACLAFVVVACNILVLTTTRLLTSIPHLQMRSALGASPLQASAPFIIESGILCACGLLGGVTIALALSSVAGDVYQHLFNSSLDLHIGLGVVVATTATVLVLLTIVALGPPLLLRKANTRVGAAPSIGERRDRFRLRSVFVAGELGTCSCLATIAVLFLSAARTMAVFDPGFDVDSVLVARIDLRHIPEVSRQRMVDALLAVKPTIRSRYGSSAVSVWSWESIPFDFSAGELVEPPVAVRDRTAPSDRGNHWPYPMASFGVDEDFFTALGIKIRRGRGFGPGDRQGSETVAIVNETMGQTLWFGGDPLYGDIRLGGTRSGLPWLKVVGVVSPSIQMLPAGLALAVVAPKRPWPIVYTPLWQNTPTHSVYINIRTRVPSRIAADARSFLATIVPDSTIGDVRSFREFLDEQGFLPSIRFKARLLGALALFGVLLCLVGVYAVTNDFVLTRSREIGLRIALGSNRGRVTQFVLIRLAPAWLIGMILGSSGAAVGGVALRERLTGATVGVPRGEAIGLSITDLRLHLLVSGSLLLIGACAMYFPLKRAVEMSPIDALRLLD